MSEPRVTEIRAHVSVGGKVQLVKFEQFGDYSMSISRTYDVDGMTEAEVDQFQRELVAKLREEVEPHADGEYQSLLTARAELNS